MCSQKWDLNPLWYEHSALDLLANSSQLTLKLKDYIEKICQGFTADMKNREMFVQQRAVAIYFIDKLALRAGKEKDGNDEADTVDCWSLRVEHI